VEDWNSATVSGTTWTTKYVAAGPYLSSLEYVVEVSVRDVFGKNGYNTGSTVKTLEVGVPSESVAFDWDAGEGLGINKYRQTGKALDVSGDVNFDDDLAVGGAVAATTITQGGQAVIDAGDFATTSAAGIAELATDTETTTGTDATRAVTPAGLEAAYGTRVGNAESAIIALETVTAQPVVRVTKTSAQATSPTAGTYTAIAFNTEDFDTHAMHDNATNNSRLTIPAGWSGYWRVTAHLENASTSAIIQLEIRKNGTAIRETRTGAAPNAAVFSYPHVTDLLQLDAADYIEVFVVSNLTSVTITSAGCSFSAEFVRSV
jgi:hypothetical protein